MARRFTPSQLKNELRRIESQRRQAISRYNQKVRQHNQRIVRDTNTAIRTYNQAVRGYNQRLRSHQQRLRRESSQLTLQTTTRYSFFRTSVVRLSAAYERLDTLSSSSSLSPQENFFADLSEAETANTIGVFNALATNDPDEVSGPNELKELGQTIIVDEIAIISEELDKRWRGALFALHPNNPEATRHFCTSVREIFTGILELKAPESSVFSALPNCARTPNGNATRRSKIEYLLLSKEIHLPQAAEFANEDIDNVIELFEILNGGTHGSSERLGISALRQVKKRVEDALIFLSGIAA